MQGNGKLLRVLAVVLTIVWILLIVIGTVQTIKSLKVLREYYEVSLYGTRGDELSVEAECKTVGWQAAQDCVVAIFFGAILFGVGCIVDRQPKGNLDDE